MKTPLMTRATTRRFSLIFVLLLAMAAWTFSISAAEEQAQQSAGQTAAQQPAVPLPENSEQALQIPAEQSALLATPAQPESAATSCPPEYLPLIQKTTTSLMAADFTFIPVKTLDPFVPFLTLDTGRLAEEEEDAQGVPLTPLQKMTLSEIERGLKAITWGGLGSRAVIEDSTGRGYIVSVGTPAGEHSGVITQILNDRLVIKQEIWDKKAKKRFPQDFTVKLAKKAENQ
jgi:hypothetical protein